MKIFDPSEITCKSFEYLWLHAIFCWSGGEARPQIHQILKEIKDERNAAIKRGDLFNRFVSQNSQEGLTLPACLFLSNTVGESPIMCACFQMPPRIPSLLSILCCNQALLSAVPALCCCLRPQHFCSLYLQLFFFCLSG